LDPESKGRFIDEGPDLLIVATIVKDRPRIGENSNKVLTLVTGGVTLLGTENGGGTAFFNIKSALPFGPFVIARAALRVDRSSEYRISQPGRMRAEREVSSK
jgi:hypothetical protein